ncbi:type II toxin-antitoxin system HipA family toxin [Emticicia sp.]|uniref:type II toxin-antitoxin system HipA family toxin n=1 Tax=Emticicia sp. TaxID=1930953 RepID=UPI003752F7BF
MNQKQRNILVYADWEDLPKNSLVGTLSATQVRGKEIFSFEYEKEWLQSKYIQLDPDLHFFSGRQFLNDKKMNFGVFMDSSPDRWGRLLMRRREAALARKEERKENLLFETDYLLGVYDEHRMGALRFKIEDNGVFLNDNQAMAAPPFTSLRELEQASLKLEQENSIEKPEYIQWLNMLMAPGSSLGGARPKASVKDTKQQLWIAKFPSRFDDKNMGAWEMVVHDLARQAGINISDAFIEKFGSRHHTFITKRFDRKQSQRTHFASAMTLLGYNDGADYQEGVSYLNLAEFIIRNGVNIEEDLEELWRRIVFSICVSNTDDHLRNHGFLVTPKGWKLSPAYDINANEDGTGLKLNISENDNSLEIDLALEVAPYFRLTQVKAKQISESIKKAVSAWQSAANKYKIDKNEQELLRRAFQNS